MKIAAAALALGALAAPALAAAPTAATVDGPPLRIYLPRSVQVDGNDLKLGRICVILCHEAALEKQARAVPMGRTPWPKEKLTLDRPTILAQLAAGGILSHQVRLTGADAVVVERHEQLVPVPRLLAAAEEFLHKAAPNPEGCIYRVTRQPREIVVGGQEEPRLVCKLAERPPAGFVEVEVAVLRGKTQLGLREVQFRRLWPVRRAVVVETIPAGEVLSEQNVTVQTVHEEQPAPAGWKPPLGLLAARRLAPGTILRDGMTAASRPDIVIRRNQMVRLRVQGDGFMITGVGQALEDGRPGEFVKVRNVDSRRVVTARVAFDGAVEPVFKR